jgi:transposase
MNHWIRSQYSTFVGIDAHKNDHHVYLINEGEERGYEWVVKNNPKEVKKCMRRIKKQAQGEIIVCYEAGPCGFVLHRQIVAEGIRCMVVAPSLIPVKPGERIKTDRRDARKLAEALQAGMLTEVRPPTEEEEAVRELTRCREAAKQAQTRARRQLIKFLLRHNRIYVEGKHWTLKHRRWLKELTWETRVEQGVFENYVDEVERRTERVKRLEQEMETQAQQEPYKKAVGWLRCFRGIDTVTALTVVTELYGLQRFTTPEDLMGFLGLAPSENSTGEKRRRGPITKTGNVHVRRLLIEAAWHQQHKPGMSQALKTRRENQPAWVIRIADEAMHRLYKRYWWLMNKGKAKNVAITAVARELVGFLWAVLFPRPEQTLNSVG